MDQPPNLTQRKKKGRLKPQPIPLRGAYNPMVKRAADWRSRATWGLLLGLTLGAFTFLLLRRQAVGQAWGRQVMDSWFALRGGQPVQDVVVLDVDEATETRWNGDFNAADLARLLRLLKRDGARGTLLVLPALFDQKLTPAQEKALIHGLRDNGATWIGVDMGERDAPYRGEATAPGLDAAPADAGAESDLSLLDEQRALVLNAARGAGHLLVSADAGGRVRDVPLVAAGYGHRWRALSFAALADHPATSKSVLADLEQSARFSAENRPRVALNYPHESPDPALTYTLSPFPHLSIEDALRQPGTLNIARGRWVVIGLQTRASQVFLTPVGGRASLAEVQAVALDNLLTGRYLRSSPPAWDWALSLLACAVVGGFAAARRPGWSGAVAALCACVAGFLSFAMWQQDIWLNPVAAWIGIGLTWLAGGVARARWQERHATRIGSVIEALTQGSELIAAQKDSDQLLPRVLAWAEHALRARGASVLLLDPETQILRFACATGPKSQELMNVTLKMGQGIAGWVAQEGVPAVVNEAALDWRFDENVDRRIGFHTRSILCVPLRVRDHMLGVVEVVNRRDGQPFDAVDAELLSAVANQAALVLENARLYERLEARVEESESELARTNGRLQAEKTLLQTVLQSMTDGVVVTDRRGRVQLMNAAASALLTELSPSVLGRPLCDALPELRAAAEFASGESASGEGKTGEGGANHFSRNVDEHGRGVVLLLRGDVDSPRVIEAHTAPLLGSASGGTAFPGAAGGVNNLIASILGSIVVFSDVTEARNVEQAKSDFVSFVAHEMRSPLTSISGFSSMLLRLEDATREANANSSRTRFLSIIRDESERLTRLINNLLDVARIESGRGVELTREAWEAAPILEAAADAQRSYSSRHQIIWEVENGLPPVFADRDKALQVLINLVSNALKYSPGGVITLRAERAKASGPPMVRFSVADQGPGISLEDRTRLFGRFERFGRGTVPQTGPVGGLGSRAKPTGTGLGLFLSKYLTEAQDGRIWVESNAENATGAMFCFTLPVADVLMLNGANMGELPRSQRALPGI